MDGRRNRRGTGIRIYDVTIVGAGLAGLQCARLLAEEGVSVLLVDRKADVAQSVHTTGIFVRRTLEDFDLPAALLGPVVGHVVLHSPRGKRQILESPHEEFRIGRMGRIYEELLRESIRGGVSWRPSTRFIGLDREADGVLRVWLEATSGREPVSTRFLVGADGAKSPVAAALGLSSNRGFILGVEDVVRGVARSGPAVLHCFLDPRIAPGYIGWAADDGQEVHVGVGGYPGSFDPAVALNELRRRLRPLYDLESGVVVERRGGLVPVGGILPRLSCPSGLLVGDAAGAVSPLTAGGLDGALRLSRFAAELLTVAVKSDSPEALALYNGDHLRVRFISRRWMRRALSAVRSPLLVEWGCALLRCSPLGGLARHVFFGRGSFPEPDRRALEGLRRLSSLTFTSFKNAKVREDP
jgi:flavin-dependent dehydrogenase